MGRLSHLALNVHSILAGGQSTYSLGCLADGGGVGYTTVTGQGELWEAERLGELAYMYWDIGDWYLLN